MRAGFLKGALKHVPSIPRLIFGVRGWTALAADCMGKQRERYRVKTKDGAFCELRPGTTDWWIFLEIFVFEIYKRAHDDIRRAKTVIDIGANVGFFSILASTMNPAAEIHAFEPFPKNLDQLRNNTRLNLNRSIYVHGEAVDVRSGTATLYFTPGDDSGCSLNQPAAQSCTVNVVHVNDLLKHCRIDRCDLLKMDCEGSERAIISALSPQVAGKIGAIIMEYHDPKDISVVSALLTGLGFRCEVLENIHTIYASKASR